LRVDSFERTNLTLSAGAVVASLALTTPAFAASLAAGALIEAINFHGLRRSTQFLFWGQISSAGGWVGVYALRFVWLAIGIGAALSFGADPVGLLVGLSLVIPATLYGAWRTRPPIDPHAPALDPEDPAWERWNPWLAREQREPEEQDA
jgi:hypothetical protein